MVYRLNQLKAPTAPVPAGVVWDLWLGSAPARPNAPDVYHPSKWRTWLDFSTGWLGDIGCHTFHAPWKGMNPKAPISFRARVNKAWLDSPELQSPHWPKANHVTWVLPGNALTADSTLTMEWFDGIEPDFYIPEELRKLYLGQRFPEEAALFIGEKGAMLLPHTSGLRLLPIEKFADVKRPQVKGGNHYNDFVTSIFDDSPLESPFEIAGPMSEAVILGSVAMRNPGKLFDWNSAALKLTKFPRSQCRVAPVLSGWLENRWLGLRPPRIRRASKLEITPVKKSFLALVI